MEDHRQEALAVLGSIDVLNTRGNLPMKPEGQVMLQATIAQTHALLYVGDMLAEINDRSAVAA